MAYPWWEKEIVCKHCNEKIVAVKQHLHPVYGFNGAVKYLKKV